MNNKKSFGFDIGATTLKLVWLSGQKNGFLLNSALMIPTPAKGMMSLSPLDEEEMIQSVRKAVIDAKISSKSVNVALPENQIYTKVLEIPVLSDKELASTIYWEAEQYIPVPLANITLAWNVLKKPLNPAVNEKMQVLMVGAPTMLITKYKRLISLAGFTLNSMETEMLSTIRALVKGPSFPSTLILNIGSVYTSLAIIRNGIMILTYSMSVGGLAISRAIAADFNFTQRQAEEYKKAYGVDNKQLGGKIGQSTEPILTSILAEVKKSLAYYSEKYHGESIRQIILSGGTAKLPGIDMFFVNNSGIETAIANPWRNIVSNNISPEMIASAPDYTIAVGLAMRDYEQ